MLHPPEGFADAITSSGTPEAITKPDAIVHQDAYSTFWKRVIDLVVVTPLLCLSVIPMLLIAIVVLLDSPGNPVFLQRRVGKNGRLFTMWKFRTMHQSSCNEIAMFVDENGLEHHKIKNDPRVTRFGALLRRTSLDELPQLVNVIAGHMSLVGPRPELPQIVASYEPWQHQRHLVSPGITGWWQVSGRSDLPMHQNTELDIYYVERQSLKLDLTIIKKTIASVVRGVGAF